jgi:hypothetical protein
VCFHLCGYSPCVTEKPRAPIAAGSLSLARSFSRQARRQRDGAEHIPPGNGRSCTATTTRSSTSEHACILWTIVGTNVTGGEEDELSLLTATVTPLKTSSETRRSPLGAGTGDVASQLPRPASTSPCPSPSVCSSGANGLPLSVPWNSTLFPVAIKSLSGGCSESATLERTAF